MDTFIYYLLCWYKGELPDNTKVTIWNICIFAGVNVLRFYQLTLMEPLGYNQTGQNEVRRIACDIIFHSNMNVTWQVSPERISRNIWIFEIFTKSAATLMVMVWHIKTSSEGYSDIWSPILVWNWAGRLYKLQFEYWQYLCIPWCEYAKMLLI